jgi:hypothetical protein
LLRLETGIHQHEAINLYERAGFTSIPPFGEYNQIQIAGFTKNGLRKSSGGSGH